MSITAITHQAQGIRAGEVIAKLAEDAYFMRVDNRVTQPPPSGTATTKLQVAALTSAAIVLEPSCRLSPIVLVQTPTDPHKVATEIVRSSLTAPPAAAAVTLAAAAAVTAKAPTTGPTGGPAAGAVAAVKTTRTATPPEPHRAATTHARRSAGDNDGFPAFFPRLRNLLLPDKFKPVGITKYDAEQDPIQWLRCYALSIENAGGNNDTKCLYFPFCLDQAPLTWLESLDKHSIDKWDQLKEQFTSNFAGAMGRLGTRMDLAMVKQEQGETLRKYMRRFFDKCATVVDVTDKEVVDLFQDGLYHRRTFEDFGRRRPKSIPHLKDMITSWADEEDKANAKYDAIRGKNKQSNGGGSSHNGNQGGRNNNNYSGPNRKRKPDNTVAAIQRPAKENSKKTSGGFKDLLKEKCPWHLDDNHTTE
jgi:hypothetical protein